MLILAINCGSSSVKYALFDGSIVTARGAADVHVHGDHAGAVAALFESLPARPDAVGHRLVHGGPTRFDPVRIDAAVRAELDAVVPLAPLHLPAEIAAIDAVAAQLPGLPQVACFDTAFHRSLPAHARRLPLPRALDDAGVRRYGFHGLSYEYISAALDSELPERAVFAHLGSGASMVAVRDGRAIETTMAFTPDAGLVMATRPGDLDPGVLLYLLDHGYDAPRLEHLLHHEAGLRAISETTGDMRELLERRQTDTRAALAVDVFCYRARLAVGALAAALGGLDLIAFTGGIGEHAAVVRAEICSGLEFLGVAIDADANAKHAARVGAGPCDVRVIETDEECVIARHVARVIGDVGHTESGSVPMCHARGVRDV